MKDVTNYGYFVMLLIVMICCKSTTVTREPVSPYDKSYTVKRIKKKKNDVYIIYVTRNDTCFKICSHYDKRIPVTGRKMKKGDRLDIQTNSLVRTIYIDQKAYDVIPPCNLHIDYYGVDIPLEGAYDILACDGLNGLYYK